MQEKLDGSGGGGDQWLYPGSRVRFDGIFKCNVVKYPLSDNCFGNTACTGITTQEYINGQCMPYHWIPLNDWTVVDENGNVLSNQTAYGGKSWLINNNVYTVEAIHTPSDSARLTLNGRQVWVYCKQLYEVSDK